MSDAIRLSYRSDYQSARSSITYWKRQVAIGRVDATDTLKKWETILEQIRKAHRIRPPPKVITSRVMRPRWIAPKKEVVKETVKEVVASIWIPSQLSWD
jgi:hypothetical protein